MISGRCSIDLSRVETDPRRLDDIDEPGRTFRHRLGCLASLPDGCNVDIEVGKLYVWPEAVRLIAAQTDRLNVVIRGDAWTVPKWLSGIANPDADVSYADGAWSR